jgi:hypothetical protein
MSGRDGRRPAGPPPTGAARTQAMVGRWSGLLREAWRLEDVLLAAWVLAQPIIARSQGHAVGGGDPFGGSDPLLGLAYLGATVLAIVCLVTRPRGADARAVREPTEWILVGPLGAGLALTGAIATDQLFGAPGAGFVLAFGAVVAGAFLPGLLPPVPVVARRILVLPFVLITASTFNVFVAAVAGALDVRSLFVGGLWTGLQALPVLLAFAVAFTGVYYLMLVVAPRELAEREGNALHWLARYALFLAAELIAATFLGVTV